MRTRILLEAEQIPDQPRRHSTIHQDLAGSSPLTPLCKDVCFPRWNAAWLCLNIDNICSLGILPALFIFLASLVINLPVDCSTRINCPRPPYESPVQHWIKRSVHIDLGFISGNPVLRVSRQHNTGLTVERILRSSLAHPLLTFFCENICMLLPICLWWKRLSCNSSGSGVLVKV